MKDMGYMMNLTLKIKLCPDAGQFDALKRTMTAFNAACDFIGEVAFKHRCANKIKLQTLVYAKVRAKFGLSAQMTVRAIAKTVEAYKRDRNIQPKFRPDGAMVYDQRILSWKGLDKASLLTLDGRIIVPTLICDYHRPRLDRIRGQADLILIKGTFYLCVVVDVPEPDEIKTLGALGIDLGIVNIAVDSDGEIHSGEKVEKVRGKMAKLRSALQECGTRSATRHLRKISGQEARYRTNVNHCISKKLVAKAKDTCRAIALEDLKGIRRDTVVRKAQRSRHSSWAFGQLREFVAYKAKLAGVPVVLVDPRNTSRTCPECSHIDKRNRLSQSEFKCRNCGFAGFADGVAARNIAARATVNAPIVATDFSGHFVPPLVTSPAL